jgi:hypothetical protein
MEWQYIVCVLTLKLQITKKLKHGAYTASDMDTYNNRLRNLSNISFSHNSSVYWPYEKHNANSDHKDNEQRQVMSFVCLERCNH